MCALLHRFAHKSSPQKSAHDLVIPSEISAGGGSSVSRSATCCEAGHPPLLSKSASHWSWRRRLDPFWDYHWGTTGEPPFSSLLCIFNHVLSKFWLQEATWVLSFFSECSHVPDLTVLEVGGESSTITVPGNTPLEDGDGVTCPRWRAGTTVWCQSP